MSKAEKIKAEKIKAEKIKAEKIRLLNANIEYYLIMSGYSKEQLAAKLGMSLASLYNKMKDIDKFTFREITVLFAVLKLDDETKLKLMAS